MGIAAIVFDIGGVILRHPKTISASLWSLTFGIPHESADRHYRSHRNDWMTGKVSGFQLMNSLKKQYKHHVSTAELLQIYRDNYIDIAIIDHDLMSIIKRLQRIYTLAVSSNTQDLHHQINENRGLFHPFHRVYMSYQIGHIKPDKRAFIHIIGDLKILPEKILFVDDKIQNIHAAEELGFLTHHYKGRLQFVDDLIERNIL